MRAPESPLTARPDRGALQQHLTAAGCGPAMLEPCRRLLDGWLGVQDAGAPIAEALLETMVTNAVSYQRWQEGGTDGQQAGFLALHARCVRLAGSVDRGTEVASETYLDIRERLERTLRDAQERGRWVDFRRPDPEGPRNVARYHNIQARFRVQGRWRRERFFEVLDEGIATGSPQESAAVQRVETQTYSLPLHFAGLWFQLDAQGQRKDLRWWWSALLHGLGLAEIEALAGERNDPTEAVLRMQARMSASVGAARWLRRQLRAQPYWQQVSFGLPALENAVARSSAAAALDILRPALSDAIRTLEADPEELGTLQKILVDGRTVRTNLKYFRGTAPQERRERMMSLSEEAGRRASLRLLRSEDPTQGQGGSGSGGSDGDDHAQARQWMRTLAAGGTLSTPMLRVWQAHLSRCPDCSQHWMSLCDQESGYTEQVIAASVQRAPRRAPLALAGLAVAALAVLLIVLMPPQPELGYRGEAGARAVRVDLSVLEDGQTEAGRLQQDRPYGVGDRIYFRLSGAGGTGPAALWVDGPQGREVIVALSELGETPVWVEQAAQKLYYRFDAPGLYVFSASPEALGVCPEERCMTIRIEVR